MKKNKQEKTDQIGFYFYEERWILLVITVTGLLYNFGMAAGPWFEGMMVQYLCDILQMKRRPSQMVLLALIYVLTIASVQFMRFGKRFFVRKFANHLSKRMKMILFRNILFRKKSQQKEAGDMVSWILSDVDACVEGMRKFTTEVFDTGVVMLVYFLMLLSYDWRLTLLTMIFPPIAYFLAERLKTMVTKKAAQSRESNARLNTATLERISNALTYRIYGQETNQNKIYESYLSDYEKKAIGANLWENTMQPLYQVISMFGTVFLIYFGGKNVLGIGWSAWNVAAFTTFFSCYKKLAVKSSKAAKLFNAVQKAKVSWGRIKPFLQNVPESEEKKELDGSLRVSHLSFGYPNQKTLIWDLSFTAQPGQMIGVTGEVACGKSTLGKLFLGEFPYEGEISMGEEKFSSEGEHYDNRIGYLGHQPELFSGTIEENICLGKTGNPYPVLQAVCMEKEIEALPEGIHTVIGNDGVRLSGGQQARLALARTLYHRRKLLILDDPFSAVDKETEQQIFRNLQSYAKDSIILLISHRLAPFPQMDQVLFMENGFVFVADHTQMLRQKKTYRALYEAQAEGEILGVGKKEQGGERTEVCCGTLRGKVETVEGGEKR